MSFLSIGLQEQAEAYIALLDAQDALNAAKRWEALGDKVFG